MNRMLAIFLALSLGANVGLVLRVLDAPPAAQHLRRPHRGGKPFLDRALDHHLERLSADLALRAEQQAALREAHGVLFPSIRRTHQAIEQQRDAVARAFAEEVGTPGAFRARVQGLQQTQALLDSLLTEVLLAEVAVLDPDQRAGYIEISPWSRRYQKPPPGSGSSPLPPKGGLPH
jgi:hypothetical protein